jgi:hypothetical protein
MKTILTILLLAVVGIAQAQVTEEWVAIYDGSKRSDDARDIVTDGRGNVYVTGFGYFESDTLRQGIITAKYSSSGERLWLRGLDVDTSASDAAEYGYYVAVDSSGNVYVAGDIITRPAGDVCIRMVVVKYDANGNLQWVQPQPNRTGTDRNIAESEGLAIDREGNIIVAGQGKSATSVYDYLIYKYRPNGELAWQKAHNGPASLIDRLHAMTIDDAGNIYVTGTIALSDNNLDPMTIKYDSAGNVVWQKQFVNPKLEVMNSVQVDAVGNVYVSGYLSGVGNDTATRVLTIKYNPQGDTLWSRRWRGPKDNVGGLSYLNKSYDMKLDRFGNVYVLANQNTVNPTPLSLIRYNTDGELQWANDYPNTNGHLPIEIAVDHGGNVYVAAKANRGGEWLTLKFDATGDFAWEQPYKPDGIETAAVRCWGVAVDHQSNVYVCGAASFRQQAENFVTIKYSQGVASVAQIPPGGDGLTLLQNHPNPFSGTTTIDYTIPAAGYARLVIYSMPGWEIARPVDGFVEPGTYRVDFESQHLPPGNYIYRLEGDGYTDMKVMSIVR